MNGAETGQLPSLTCPIAGLSTQFVTSKFLHGFQKKLDGLISSPRANNVVSWLVEGREEASRQKLLKHMDFVLCGLKFFTLSNIAVSGWEGALQWMDIVSSVSFFSSVEKQWVCRTSYTKASMLVTWSDSVCRRTYSAATSESAPNGSLIHFDCSVTRFLS